MLMIDDRFMQPQGQLQILMNMLHKSYNVQEAIDSPRFCISAGMPDNDAAEKEAKSGAKAGDIDSETFLEDGITVRLSPFLLLLLLRVFPP